MRDVGNVDTQEPVLAAWVHSQRDRIVEIAGIDRVDRDCQPIGEVFAAGGDFFLEAGPHLPSLFQDIFGKGVGQAEGADDRQGIDAGLTMDAKSFDDDGFAAFFERGKAYHLDNDLVVGLDPLGAGIADDNAMAENRAIDADITLAVAREVGADELAGGAFRGL